MQVGWKTVGVVGAIWTLSALVGAAGVYFVMRPTPGVAHGSSAAPASASPASSVGAASTAVASAVPPATTGASAFGATPVSAPRYVASAAAVSAASGANEAPGSALPRESDPVPSPAGRDSSLPPPTASEGSDGKIDVPRMALALGPFPDRMRSMACVPRHLGRPGAYDRPTWACAVTLAGRSQPYSVRLNGPDGLLAIYSESLFSSSYAFVYVAAHDGKDAHFSATIDPKAAPYQATENWTARLMTLAVDQALRLDAAGNGRTSSPESTGQHNADSWAAVGVR